MTYTIKIANGHYVVDMTEDTKDSPTEIMLEILKYMTCYKLAEIIMEEVE